MRITLYGDDNEAIATYERGSVPWRVLKKAIRLAKSLENGSEMTEEAIDELAELVVEVFGNQFTVEQLNEGADVGEMMAVLNTIVAKAQGSVNPTLPG